MFAVAAKTTEAGSLFDIAKNVAQGIPKVINILLFWYMGMIIIIIIRLSDLQAYRLNIPFCIIYNNNIIIMKSL